MSSSITLSGVSSLNLEEIMIENLSKTNTTNGGILPSSQVANVNESSLNDSVQTIELQGNDTSNTYPIIGKEVNILPSKNSIQTRINASNKIKVNRIVNYEWDQRFNNGQLISVHKSGVYFAYSILTNLTGKVRIFHKKLNEKALLKSFTGRVVDLSFAYYDKEVLLGILDEIGCLQIFKITLENSKMQTSLVLTIAGSRKLAIHTISPIDEEQAHLYSSSESNSSQVILDSTQRIIWCSFIPDSNEVPTSGSASDAHKVFVITRQHQADIFHMNLLEKNYDCSNPLDADKLLKGHLAIREHRSTILSASFSPDGTAITTSSVDGEVNLFKFTFEEEEEENEEPLNEEEEYNFNKVLSLKCLKKWHPHGDKPVNSLYFLDDHKNPQPDAQFWSFLLTGASFNREIKIWSCSNWQCMQTISLKPDPLMTATSRLSMFKSSIDLTSNYLVLSDIARKCFYILHIHANLDDNLAYCSAISEFILAFPALSFDIIDSQRIKAKKYNQLNNVNSQQQQGHSDYDLANDLLNTSSLSSSVSSSTATLQQQQQQSSLMDVQESNDLVTMIRLYCIQTKQLQEMQIFLSGEQSINAYNNNSVSPPPPLPLQASQQAAHGISSLPINLTPKSSSSSLLQQLLPNMSEAKQKLLNQAAVAASTNFSSEPEEANHHHHSHHHYHHNRRSNQLGSVNADSLNGSTASLNIKSKSIRASIQHDENSAASETVLMTPDAFINSPNKSASPTGQKSEQQQNLPIIQSFLNASQNSLISSMSSRASSLTQVTSATNLINPLSGQVAAVAPPPVSNPIPPSAPQPQRSNEVKTKNASRRRTFSSVSSSSSSSSSSESSSTNSSDPNDQEIALLSSVAKNNDLTVTSLLNKVSIENEDDNESTITLKPNNPLSKIALNHNLNSTSNSNDLDSIKSLLVTLNKSLLSQRDEIESLKKQHKSATNELKDQIDASLLKMRNASASSSSSTSNVILQNEDAAVQKISSNILIQLMPKLEKTIKDEVNKSVQTQFSARLLDQIREQMSKDLAEKVKSMDNILKDSVSKLFKSKSTMDSISASVVGSMQGTIVNTYRETFQKVIVPNFEKSCQNMYQQVNNSFAKGTQDYLLEFDQLTKQHRKLFDENKEPLLAQMKQFNDQMHTHGAQVAADMASNLQQQFDNHLRNTNAILQDTIISSVKAIIKEEIQLAMREQQHTLPETLLSQMRRSGANTPSLHFGGGGAATATSNSFVMDRGGGTPAPNQDTQSQISAFIQKGQLNSAFQVALCAADLNLLINLCELVNPTQVFEHTLNSATKKSSCQLQQPVILSLIQQLSQDLTTNLQLKIKYLEEAVVNLDLTNALTREHTPGVIGQLVSKLQQFVQVKPNDKITKSIRMLLMASQSLLVNQPRVKQNSHHQSPAS